MLASWFCYFQGFMWDIAPEFKALLLFVEHRYYGESMPYGNDSYKVCPIAYECKKRNVLWCRLWMWRNKPLNNLEVWVVMTKKCKLISTQLQKKVYTLFSGEYSKCRGLGKGSLEFGTKLHWAPNQKPSCGSYPLHFEYSSKDNGMLSFRVECNFKPEQETCSSFKYRNFRTVH